jgi:hypothetical protein
MSRSRGALSRTGVDLRWPHQVAMPIEQCTGKNYQAPYDFCRSLSIYSLHKQVTDGEQNYHVFQFREPEDALKFKEQFGGMPFYPEDLKGKMWTRPPGDKRRPRKARDPYDWR